MYSVYVLQSLKTKEFYKGLTSNLDKRLRQHFKGGVSSIKAKLPLQLIHVEFVTRGMRHENWKNSLNLVLVEK